MKGISRPVRLFETFSVLLLRFTNSADVEILTFFSKKNVSETNIGSSLLISARPAFYNYICAMLLLNVVSLFGCVLLGNGAGFGLW